MILKSFKDSFITSDVAVHHGDPCIRYTSVRVDTIVNLLNNNTSHKEITSIFGNITEADIEAAILYTHENR